MHATCLHACVVTPAHQTLEAVFGQGFEYINIESEDSSVKQRKALDDDH